MIRMKDVAKPLTFWQDGFVVQGARRSAALLEVKPLTLAVSISVRGRNSSSIDLFILCVQTLQALIGDWYNVKYQVQYVEPRTNCVFTQDQLDAAALKGKRVVQGSIVQAKSDIPLPGPPPRPAAPALLGLIVILDTL